MQWVGITFVDSQLFVLWPYYAQPFFLGPRHFFCQTLFTRKIHTFSDVLLFPFSLCVLKMKYISYELFVISSLMYFPQICWKKRVTRQPESAFPFSSHDGARLCDDCQDCSLLSGFHWSWQVNRTFLYSNYRYELKIKRSI